MNMFYNGLNDSEWISVKYVKSWSSLNESEWALISHDEVLSSQTSGWILRKFECVSKV